MVDRAASSMAEINTALGLSSSGDTVTVTAGGDFSGNVSNHIFASGEVVVRAADPDNRPDFGFTRIEGCDRIGFEDIEFNLDALGTPSLLTDGGSICLVESGSNRIRIERCHSQGRSKTFFFNGGTGHVHRWCTVDLVGQGGYTYQAVSDMLVEYNTSLGVHMMDGLSHGDFMQLSGTCDNVTIRKNFGIDIWSFSEQVTGRPAISSVSGDGTITVTTTSAHGLSTGERVVFRLAATLRVNSWGWYRITVLNSTQFTVPASAADAANWSGFEVWRDSGSIIQGIFISNGAFTNCTVDGNLIMTNAVGGIHEQPGTITTNSGHTVTDNTVLNNEHDGTGNSTQIAWSGASTKSGNIAETGADSGLAVQDDTPANSDYYEKVYATCINGDGSQGGRDINDFAIVAASIGVDNGAFALINELLAISGLEITSPAVHNTSMGTVSAVGTVGQSDHKLRYTPDAGFHGIAKGTHDIDNGQGGTDTGRWAIPVTKTGSRSVGGTFPATPQGSGFIDLDVLAGDID